MTRAVNRAASGVGWSGRMAPPGTGPVSDSPSHPDVSPPLMQPLRVVSTGFEADGLSVPPREEAVRRLRAHGLPAEALARNLTPLEWRLMGLEVAWARGAEVVVFATGDTEPGGIGRINRSVDLRIERCAAVRLNRPVVVE